MCAQIADLLVDFKFFDVSVILHLQGFPGVSELSLLDLLLASLLLPKFLPLPKRLSTSYSLSVRLLASLPILTNFALQPNGGRPQLAI